MKCSICEFYEAESRDDLRKHQQYGHTPEQVGLTWTSEIAPLSATYTSGSTTAPGGSSSFTRLPTMSASTTYVSFTGTGNVRDFSLGGGVVMSDGRVVMRVIQASPTHEIWEWQDKSGTRLSEGHIIGDFDKTTQAMIGNSTAPREKEEEQSLSSIYKKMRAISEAEERMIRESEIGKTNPALSPLESIEKMYGERY